MILTPVLIPPVLLGGSRPQGTPAPSAGLPPVKELRPAGKCPHGVSLLLLIMDNSGSVTAPGGADPVSNRFAETRRALEAVAAVCRCGQEYMALVTFDTPTGDIPPTIITKGLPGIADRLSVDPNAGGSSCLMSAAIKAGQIIAEVGADHVTTVVLSDFELLDDDPGKALAALDTLPGTHIKCRLGEPTNQAYTANGICLEITPQSEPGTLARAVVKAASIYRQ